MRRSNQLYSKSPSARVPAVSRELLPGFCIKSPCKALFFIFGNATTLQRPLNPVCWHQNLAGGKARGLVCVNNCTYTSVCPYSASSCMPRSRLCRVTGVGQRVDMDLFVRASAWVCVMLHVYLQGICCLWACAALPSSLWIIDEDVIRTSALRFVPLPPVSGKPPLSAAGVSVGLSAEYET